MSAPDVKKGQRVILVLANGDRTEAKAIADGPDDGGRIDLAVTKHPRHGDFTITRAPHDPTGTKADSWHLQAPPPKAAPATKSPPKADESPETPGTTGTPPAAPPPAK